MARITVDDCLKNRNNRFELVIEASKRARKLSMGTATALVDWENDKPTVVALREIAAGYTFDEQQISSEKPIEKVEENTIENIIDGTTEGIAD